MAIATAVNVITTALWPQGDIRDPLGVWGFRLGVTGDASGGSIKVTAQAAAEQAAAYLYTCYGVTIARITGTPVADLTKVRVLTSWPNIDPVAGVQAFAKGAIGQLAGSSAFSAPVSLQSALTPLLEPNDRFLLLFDPRPSAGVLFLVELEMASNVDTETWSFEGYGYYWDRSVLNAPGGPRHPGSS